MSEMKSHFKNNKIPRLKRRIYIAKPMIMREKREKTVNSEKTKSF